MIKRQVMSDEIEQTFAVALEMEQGGNFQQAADLYSAILAIDDRHVPAYQALSQLQIELEKPEAARQTALRGLDLAESDLRLTVLLAKAEIMMGHYTAGREYCRKVLKTSPTELTAQRLIINSYEHEQNWIEVNRVATDMHREHPNDRQFLSQLAFSGFRLLRDKHNFVPESIIRCQKLMAKAISKSETEQQKDKFLPCLAETFWYAGEPKKSLEILDDYLNRYPQDIEAQFNACFIHRTLYNWDAFYDAFEKGIESGARLSYRGDIARWDLSRPKSDIVLVVPEQGVGDEIEFFHNLAIVVENAAKVYVACEPRLVPVLNISHPEVIAVPVKRVDHESMAIPEEVKRDITSWIAGGSLAAIAYQSSGKHHYQASYFSPPNDQVEKWSSHFDELKKAHNKKHVIGLSWRSGLAGASRNIHFLSVDDVARLVEAFPEALFVNLQYDDCSKEIRKIKKLSGVDIIQLEDIDLRDDFVGTGALIEACDLVITAATAIFRLTNAIGKECHLFYGWDKDSDHNVPVKLEWETGFGYYYPPLIENKYPVVDSIVKHVTGRLSSQ
ncbi:tetratricopeptide repeat protein [Veronia nyctiphanis]|nr:tetratricopeptide repeat protein [Veronia nyctiphanis]